MLVVPNVFQLLYSPPIFFYPTRQTTLFASPIAQHKKNFINSLIRAVRGCISLILIQHTLTNPQPDDSTTILLCICIIILSLNQVFLKVLQ